MARELEDGLMETPTTITNKIQEDSYAVTMFF